MRILPDGTVEIRNKNTGETKIVQPADLPSYGIPYSAYAGELEAAKKVGVETSAQLIEPPSSTDVKKSDTLNSTVTFIKNLEDQFNQAGGGTKGVGPGARIKGAVESLKGKAGLNESAAIYDDARSGFAATLKSLTGDTGVLTDQDFARLSKLLPGLGSTKKEATEKFNQLRQQIAAKFGGKETKTEFAPQFENNRGAIASLTDMLFPSATTFAEKATQGELTQQKQPLTPQESVPTIAGPLGFLLSRPDIFKETIGPAAEIAGGMELGGVLKNKVSGAGNILNPKPALSAARQQAAEAVGSKVSTQPIISAGNKYVSRDPTASRLWNDVLKPALEKNKELSIPELLDQVKVWNDAYTSAGRVGKTALAGLNDALARSAKEVIKTSAPEVAKYTSKLAQRYGLEKVLGRFGPAAVGAAGGVAGATILGKLLNQKGY